MINLLLLNNFYPVISYRRVQKESDGLLYTVWSLVMVRNQLPAQVVEQDFEGKIPARRRNGFDQPLIAIVICPINFINFSSIRCTLWNYNTRNNYEIVIHRPIHRNLTKRKIFNDDEPTDYNWDSALSLSLSLSLRPSNLFLCETPMDNDVRR